MLLHRPPHPSLAPFVERLWHLDETADRAPRCARERALPTGRVDLVIRLSPAPIRIFEDVEGQAARTFGHAVVVGARASFHVRDTSSPSCSVGAHLRPGGAAAVLGIPAGELAGRHTTLGDLWGRQSLRERLLDETSPHARLVLLEDCLLARLTVRPKDPAVAHALALLGTTGGCSTARLARETGLSQRWLIERFRAAVGLTPKVYARILRFQNAIAQAGLARSLGWAQVALRCGYYDQSHLSREFQAIAGMPPGAYEPLSVQRPNHVPVGPPLQERPRRAPASG
jgi:AraC-like DNA-binding protein